MAARCARPAFLHGASHCSRARYASGQSDDDRNGAPHYLRSFFLGGLVAYSANLPSLFRHAARQVGQILKGAKPGEIPFYRATKLDLVINLKTAKALGLTVPPTVLVRADEIIE